jgi:glycosyltransferase involved in cell wall biosynthesis
VLYLVIKVLPLVRRERPDVSLLISGVDPSPRVRQLAEQDPLITVTGWVKDIRTSYVSARVFVAPMQIGTGLQNKLLEAMAMGMPCITSALANNAVGAPPGEGILIGHDPASYAAHILRLLKDEEERRRIAGNGHRHVLATFDWARAVDTLDGLITAPVRAASPLPIG